MNLENCFICKRPILELEGQFDKLDTFLLEETDAAYQEAAFGWCHTRCLSTSKWGEFWSERRIWHMTEVMGFKKIDNIDNLTAIRNPNTGTVTVIQNNGVTFHLKSSYTLDYKKKSPGGILLPISEEMNLELDNSTLVQEIKDTLVKTKSFPLIELVKSLELEDYLLYPEAIADGAIQFDKALKREWIGNWISALAVYDQFVPQAVIDIVCSKD
ncbi:MAG: hypothetical protein AAFW70_06310 [Cyanobacteria bacterium J06635_10]